LKASRLVEQHLKDFRLFQRILDAFRVIWKLRRF